MSKPVRTAVFPVAGLGTRCLRATKAMPVEELRKLDLEDQLNVAAK
ncbi:UTP-glucose-1-phosphate uridylyltransferase [Devosia subaequoris]|uniref:UTP-glucose-1-phosphate uridylyltransferase n=1 Tax=Devosia subaequoris TaxID=395930 RepID=A0A7W6IQ38_9HYPH|nr:UTP-glucose-1-phosphate uridylyltransferase [Devosia subaequoris]